MIISACAFCANAPELVLAYLDPGSGSMIFQIIAAAGVSMLVAFARARTVISGVFVRIFSRNKSGNEPSAGKQSDDHGEQ